jgi:hypothetical protein
MSSVTIDELARGLKRRTVIGALLPPLPPIPMKDEDIAAYFLSVLVARASTSGTFVVPGHRWFQFRGLVEAFQHDRSDGRNAAINHAIAYGWMARTRRGVRLDVPMDAEPYHVSGKVTPANVVLLALAGGDGEFASLLAEVVMNCTGRIRFVPRTRKDAKKIEIGDPK